MPKLFASEHVIKVLYSKGFVFVSQRGSHMKFRKRNDKVLTVIVPAGKKEIPIGTFRSVLRQSNLKQEDFD